MNRKLLNIFIIFVMVFSLSTTALAKDSASPFANENTKSYIIIMVNDPIASYSGDLAEYEATKPGKGEKAD